MIHYRSVKSGGIKVFYREDGEPKAPTALLLARTPDLIAHVSQFNSGAR